MITGNVTVCGRIDRTATTSTNKKGEKVTSVTIKVNLPEGNKISQCIIQIRQKGEASPELKKFRTGNLVEVNGKLFLRKYKNETYIFLTPDSLNQAEKDSKEGIKGELEVYGKIGDEAKICDSQKGKKYLRFSAYSSELNGEEREFTWVKCIRFGEEKEDFVKKGAAIHLTGEIKAEMYKGKISLTCFVKYLSPWQKNNKEG